MIKSKTIYYWHIHHGVLYELVTEPIERRIKYIKLNKPSSEIELRLRLLKPVKSKRAIAAIKTIESAWKVYKEQVDSASKVYNEAITQADIAYYETTTQSKKVYEEVIAQAKKASDEVIVPAEKAYYETIDLAKYTHSEIVAPAIRVYDEAFAKAQKAYDETFDSLFKIIEEKHKKECVDCPWDGKSIFPKDKMI